MRSNMALNGVLFLLVISIFLYVGGYNSTSEKVLGSTIEGDLEFNPVLISNVTASLEFNDTTDYAGSYVFTDSGLDQTQDGLNFVKGLLGTPLAMSKELNIHWVFNLIFGVVFGYAFFIGILMFIRGLGG